MIVRVRATDLCHRRHTNLSLLIEKLARFKTQTITGYIEVEETSFLKNLRLRFVGTEDFADVLLVGPAFSPLLLEVPSLTAQLEELVAEFTRQVHALEPDPVASHSLQTIDVPFPEEF